MITVYRRTSFKYWNFLILTIVYLMHFYYNIITDFYFYFFKTHIALDLWVDLFLFGSVY